ncbi:hypothetical protein [Rickettsiella massiliensis]|uniref:hypothetical protein n=1 Tax=Rickettsiella massiliensis TaxID=676517 RepID=UPI00029A93A7|nr:hypothetical protein [Rickettsiella massiliensis]
MAIIKVNVLNFHGVFSSHIELVLENLSDSPHTYYIINRWKKPCRAWGEAGITGVKGRLTEASSIYSFDIQADPFAIVEDWKTYYNETKEEAWILGKNCAVATQHFLTKFAEVPEPEKYQLSFNYLTLGLFWLNIIPCPVMLPGRIMDNAKRHTKDKLSQPTSISNLTRTDNNTLLESNNRVAALVIKSVLTRFIFQIEGLLNEKAHNLEKNRHTDAADAIKDLVKNIKNSVEDYKNREGEPDFNALKEKCGKHIKNAKPILEQHRGKIGKLLNQKFTLFNTNSINKISKIEEIISKLDRVYKTALSAQVS